MHEINVLTCCLSFIGAAVIAWGFRVVDQLALYVFKRFNGKVRYCIVQGEDNNVGHQSLRVIGNSPHVQLKKSTGT